LKPTTSQLILIATVAAAVSTAHAAPVNPGGIYSESKITGAKGTSGASVPDQSITGQVKTWVSQKMTGLASYWGSASKPAPVARRAAPAPSQQRTVSAPSVSPTRTLAAPPTKMLASAPVAGRQPATAEVFKAPAALIDPPGLTRKADGVAVYDLSTSESIPRLNVGREDKVKMSDYGLDSRMQQVMDSRIVTAFPSPDLLLSEQMKALTTVSTGLPTRANEIRDVVFSPKGKVSREAFDKIVLNLAPERPLQLANYKELSQDEMRFLSGLLLYQQGDKCPVAVGLFHKLSKSPGWEAEADYYLAMCSRKLGLESDFYERARRILTTQDVHYSRKILKEVGADIPYEFVDTLGLALSKAVGNPKIMEKLDAQTMGNIAYIMTEFGASTQRFKTALDWSKKVPADHSRNLQARFLSALAEYQSGSKEKATQMQESLIADLKTDKQKAEFQALVALNVARMYFQESKFKPAHEAFLKVYKDHPMWLTSLTELGWSQLMSGDYEGAIGNMYSIQSPFFSAVYKPESYVIRTIGYLNLCQYGDAYKMLSMLEHEYKPSLEKMEAYAKKNPNYYQTVRNFMTAPKGAKEVDGLPVSIVREMARHRDFTNLQKSFNRQIDERALYSKADGEVAKGLKRAQWLVTNSRNRIDALRKQLGSIKAKPALEQNRNQWTAQLEKEMDDLNGYFFQVDLYNEAQATIPDYRKEVIGGADVRLNAMKAGIEKTLSNRLMQMRADLARYIDNNELLRYEVFAGAGENIRFQVAGGEKATRIPSSVIPKSKSLQWEFDGEYWEDEIGHYRSSLKNNCAGANGNVPVQQANLEGAEG
jgi:tetratricopeptide (TPR) repeat protein